MDYISKTVNINVAYFGSQKQIHLKQIGQKPKFDIGYGPVLLQYNELDNLITKQVRPIIKLLVSSYAYTQ